MEIPETEKEKRIKLASEYCELMILFFYMLMEDQLTKETAAAFLRERLKIIADNYIKVDDTAYVNDWSKLQAEAIVKTTFEHEDAETQKENVDPNEEGPAAAATATEDPAEGKAAEETMHFEEFDVDIPKSEYWKSNFRGMLIAVECASSIANYYDLYEAEKQGFKRKTWITEADDRVRLTHDEAHGQERNINELFVVGDSYLLFPGDLTHGASEKEVANCRCHVEYF